MNFTLICTDEEGTSLTKTFQTEYLPELIDHFDSFVRGCGFFPHGSIEDVPNDDSDFSAMFEDTGEL